MPIEPRIVPEDMTRTELAAVHWVLSSVKKEVLSGRPSGQVIDQALEEAIELASHCRTTASKPEDTRL